MNTSISLQEKGPTGFLVKDITGIDSFAGAGCFFPSEEQISWSNPRPLDIVFVDFVTYNKLSKHKTEHNIYTMFSNLDYSNYILDYHCDRDGWYTITHLYVWSTTYLEFQIDYGYITDGVYYCYNNGYKESKKYSIDIGIPLESFGKIYIRNGNISKIDVIYDPMCLYIANTSETLIGIEENIFCMGRIELCFEDKLKAILYGTTSLGNQLKRCNSKSKCASIDPDLTRDRDMVWMTLELLKYLVRYCKYYEALRILEMVDTCNSFCKNYSSKDMSFNSNCNCGR